MVAGGQGTTATTGYGGGGEVRRSSQVHTVLNYAEDNLNEEWSSGWCDQGMVGGWLWRPRVVAASMSAVKGEGGR